MIGGVAPPEVQHNMKQHHSRHFKVLWALAEIFCFSGLEMGWGSLIYVLKDEGVYADLCNHELPDANSTVTVLHSNSSSPQNMTDSSGNCSAQDLRLNLLYTIGVACGVILLLISGQIFSRLGTRVNRCINICLFWAGCLMVAFTSPDMPWLICPGVLFVSGPSLVFIMTSTQLSNMYSRGSIIVIGLMNGTMDSSTVIQLIIKLAHQAGFQRRHSFFIMIGVSLTTLVSTFTIFPKEYVYKSNEKPERDTVSEIPRRRVEFRKYVWNPIFILHTLWFGILLLHLAYFISTINAYLNHLTHNDKSQVSHFTDVLSYTMFCGMVSSFAAGFLYDWQKQKYKASDSLVERKIMPAIIPLIVASTLQLILSVCQMVPHTWILYLAFVDLTIFRSFLFSVAIGFLADVFPTNIFGILYTVMLIQNAIMRFVQYVLFEWWESYDGAIWHVHTLLLILSVLTFAHPVLLLIKCKQHSHKVRANADYKSRYFAAVYDDTRRCQYRYTQEQHL